MLLLLLLLVVVRDAKENREEQWLREILMARRAQDGPSERGTTRTLWPLSRKDVYLDTLLPFFVQLSRERVVHIYYKIVVTDILCEVGKKRELISSFFLEIPEKKLRWLKMFSNISRLKINISIFAAIPCYSLKPLTNFLMSFDLLQRRYSNTHCA